MEYVIDSTASACSPSRQNKSPGYWIENVHTCRNGRMYRSHRRVLNMFHGTSRRSPPLFCCFGRTARYVRNTKKNSGRVLTRRLDFGISVFRFYKMRPYFDGLGRLDLLDKGMLECTDNCVYLHGIVYCLRRRFHPGGHNAPKRLFNVLDVGGNQLLSINIRRVNLVSCTNSISRSNVTQSPNK